MKNSWLLFFIIGLTACSKSNNFTPVTNQVIALTPNLPIHSGDSVSYLALGDSYTYGAGLTEDESFPFQLAAKLSANNYKAAVPSVIASVGWTVNDLLNNLAIVKRNQKFDIVTILIGVNDEHSGTDKTTYSLQLNDLLQQAIQLVKGNSKRVFVISIPDWSVTPFAANMDTAKIKNDVKTFNSINQSASNTAGATYLDISALSEQAASDPSLTGTDGLHPTAKMYGLWINQFYATITSTFK